MSLALLPTVYQVNNAMAARPHNTMHSLKVDSHKVTNACRVASHQIELNFFRCDATQRETCSLRKVL